jgi:hypothetical protein
MPLKRTRQGMGRFPAVAESEGNLVLQHLNKIDLWRTGVSYADRVNEVRLPAGVMNIP